MKIVATCDIHYDLLESEESRMHFFTFAEDMKREESDVLILAGDTVGLGWEKLEECLELLRAVASERMMVFGNHDHWAADKKCFGKLKKLEKIIKESDVILLDREPFQMGRVGFAGNCGWYDYSLGAPSQPPDTSFEKKMLMGRVVWNDANFVDLKKTDPEYTDELIARLERDIEFLENRVDTIVAVTHHLGFKEMLREKPGDDLWAFAHAYMGSTKLGEMLLKHPKVKYHICGHSHHACRFKKSHLESINPGSTYSYKRYTVLEIKQVKK